MRRIFVCQYVLDVVLLDLHLNPFCGRLNSREERTQSVHTHDSLSSKGGGGERKARNGEEDQGEDSKQSRKSREIDRWTCCRDVHRRAERREGRGCFCRIPEAAFS